MKLERHRPESIRGFESSGAEPMHLDRGKSSVCVYVISNVGPN